MDVTASYSFEIVSNEPNLTVSVPRVMLWMGVSTTAVPHAATSSNDPTSSHGTGRSTTSRPMSAAACMTTLFVHDGRIEGDFGVTSLPPTTARKFEVENSSMNLRRGFEPSRAVARARGGARSGRTHLRSFASRYRQTSPGAAQRGS